MFWCFRHQGLNRLFERGDTSKVFPHLVNRIALALADPDNARFPSDPDLPGYRVHPLKGGFKGYRSISISGNRRMTFRIEDSDACDVNLTDYHWLEA